MFKIQELPINWANPNSVQKTAALNRIGGEVDKSNLNSDPEITTFRPAFRLPNQLPRQPKQFNPDNEVNAIKFCEMEFQLLFDFTKIYFHLNFTHYYIFIKDAFEVELIDEGLIGDETSTKNPKDRETEPTTTTT